MRERVRERETDRQTDRQTETCDIYSFATYSLYLVDGLLRNAIHMYEHMVNRKLLLKSIV